MPGPNLLSLLHLAINGNRLPRHLMQKYVLRRLTSMRTFFRAFIGTSAFTLITALAGNGSLAIAQATAASAAKKSPDPVSFAYVTEENASGSAAQTEGYAIGADGSLSPLPGTPYAAQYDGENGVGGNYFFLSDDNNGSVVTYSIGRDGALRQVAATAVGSYPLGTASEGPLTLSFDTTGKSIYPLWAENDVYQAFDIENNGSLKFVDYATAAGESSSWLSFTENDKYAYESGCYQGTPTIEGYTRGSNGGLTLTWNPELPPQPSGAQYSYCPGGAATSGNRYVVIAEQQNDEMAPVGPYQMVVYTVNETNGSLTTSNTAADAAPANVGENVTDYAFDPGGNWLAVGGASGITLFSFHVGVLKQTGTYAISEGVSQLAWDHNGHLIVYASAYGDPGSLYVFDVARGVPTVAPGSPVTNLQSGGYLAVKALR